jgi:hypothetical protein
MQFLLRFPENKREFFAAIPSRKIGRPFGGSSLEPELWTETPVGR